LLDVLIGSLLNQSCRAAQPGEFTMRAFLAGKLDLTRAEAVLAVIQAGSRDELRQALAHLAGGVSRPLHELRQDLLDLLSDVEAGLDFADEDIRFVDQTELLNRLAKGMAQATLLQKQLSERTVGHRPFQVVIVGRPNVGKSSLFNALGKTQALVSPQPGTTRDYLVHHLKIDNVTIELIDTPGWQAGIDAIDEQAQHLGQEQAARADLQLLCLESGRALADQEEAILRSQDSKAVMPVSTKCDLAAGLPNTVAVSVATGFGVESLRFILVDRARAHYRPALAPSLSRCRHHVDALLAHLRQAHAAVLYEDPPEVLALELRSTLQELGEMTGAVYTDDLLDRIFSRFCIGK
jgi:tRNA modification GTPase